MNQVTKISKCKMILYLLIPSQYSRQFLTQGSQLADRLRDESGNLNNWWSQSAIDSFQNAAKCFVDQYSSFQVRTAGRTVKVSGRPLFLSDPPKSVVSKREASKQVKPHEARKQSSVRLERC